jgi:hypothetical protein
MILEMTDLFAEQLLVELAAATMELAGATVHLFASNTPVNRDTIKADLLAGEAAFTGYAMKTVTWGTPARSSDGQIEMTGIMTAWRPTDAVTPNTVYALWLAKLTSGDVLGVATFDNPVPMQDALDELIVTLRFRPLTNSLVVYID